MPSDVTIHASCVAFDGKGVLIKGASGSGKSALALQLIGLGAELIADDQVMLSPENGITGSAPKALQGLIEARHFGILRAPFAKSAPIECVIDMDQIEKDRLPPHRTITSMGKDIPLFYKVEGVHFAPAIQQFLRTGLLLT